jgi:hypothetical protein
MAAELQGNGFDSPNRLFYSLNFTLENTLNQKSDLRESIPEMYYFPDLFMNKNELKLGRLSTEENEINDVIINNINENESEKYDYLSNLRNYFESNQIFLNRWINLIFGINQEKFDKKKYYSSEMYIHLDPKQQEIDFNDPLLMEKFEFGVQPLKLFDEKFPEKKNKPNKYEKIKKYNILRYEKEHIEIKNDKRMCFKCQCFNNINQDYIDIIFEYFCKFEENNRKKKKKWKLLEDDSLFLSFNYIIIGDVLGNVTLLQNNSKKKKSKSNEDDLSDYKIIKKLTDHYKQIKYIDYNPRLNLFLSYSLDGFINIYVFPKCKLVRAIKVNNITNSNEILKKVVLISNPFPMIFTYDNKNMYTITLNGDLIKKEELKKENIEIYPCVDKNCGLINDCILIEYGDNKIKKEISLPLLI